MSIAIVGEFPFSWHRNVPARLELDLQPVGDPPCREMAGEVRLTAEDVEQSRRCWFAIEDVRRFAVEVEAMSQGLAKEARLVQPDERLSIILAAPARAHGHIMMSGRWELVDAWWPYQKDKHAESDGLFVQFSGFDLVPSALTSVVNGLHALLRAAATGAASSPNPPDAPGGPAFP